MLIPRTSVYGIEWPVLPGPAAASMLAMQYQLEQSQWLPPQIILQHQFNQLARVLAHAYETVPFYHEHFQKIGFNPKERINPEIFTQLPFLQRSDIQSAGGALLSRQVPRDHGRLLEQQTSGSSGMPIKTFGTEVTQFFWRVFTLRDHLWHKRNLTGKLASIRTKVKDGIVQGWGPSTDVVFNTGQSAMLNIHADIDTQVKWLKEHDPDYLLSYPSNIYALAQLCIEADIRLPSLREVRTIGEVVVPELRAICMKAWGAPVVDIYSAQEIGYIALQCPEHEHYHIQSENVLVEVLNEEDRPCAPGEIGRVVITTLHNFAMPLIRYEILDYAERGELCTCGRGLPTINRIMGRVRHMLIAPTGEKHWPIFNSKTLCSIAPILQIQMVQHTLHAIEVRLVAKRAISQTEEALLKSTIIESLGYPFELNFTYMDEIPRNRGGKYEDFVSLVSSP